MIAKSALVRLLLQFPGVAALVPGVDRRPAASVCSKKSAGMMWPSSRIVSTPMFFISASCLAMSAAE